MGPPVLFQRRLISTHIFLDETVVPGLFGHDVRAGNRYDFASIDHLIG